MNTQLQLEVMILILINMFLYIIMKYLEQHNEHNLSNILEL